MDMNSDMENKLPVYWSGEAKTNDLGHSGAGSVGDPPPNFDPFWVNKYEPVLEMTGAGFDSMGNIFDPTNASYFAGQLTVGQTISIVDTLKALFMNSPGAAGESFADDCDQVVYDIITDPSYVKQSSSAQMDLPMTQLAYYK